MPICDQKIRTEWPWPQPGEPVIVVSDSIWQYVPVTQIETVNSLLGIITNTFQNDPHLYTQAVEQLEQELDGVSRHYSREMRDQSQAFDIVHNYANGLFDEVFCNEISGPGVWWPGPISGSPMNYSG